METVEERIVRLLVEEKTLLKILRTIDGGQFDNEGLNEWSNGRHICPIIKDNPIWVN